MIGVVINWLEAGETVVRLLLVDGLVHGCEGVHGASLVD